MRMRGQVALVTGSATGQGRAMVLAFAREGASVVINYSKSEKEALATMDEVKALGVKAIVVRADVSQAEQVEALVDRTVAEFGRIDLLVNNAGTTTFIPMRNLASLTEEVWDRTLAVNLKGSFLCSKAVAEVMLKQKSGRIINNASTAGLRPWGSSLPYCCSKAGLIMLTRCLAVALAPDIRVNAIAPGVVMTRWVAGFSEEVLYARAKTTPLKRNATPEDVTQVALFLASDAGYLTGEVIVVDGGWSM